MKVITRKVFSYCNDIPEELQDRFEENACDIYIGYIANSKEWLEKEEYDEDLLANLLIELGAEEGEEVLIHMDW